MSFLEQAKASYSAQGSNAGDLFEHDDDDDDDDDDVEEEKGDKGFRQQQGQREFKARTYPVQRRRRRAAQTGAFASAVTLLPLLAAGLFAWRWWQSRQRRAGHKTKGSRAASASRSAFSFDNKKGTSEKVASKKDGLSSVSAVQAIPAVRTSAPPPNMSGPGPRVSGNPKKNYRRKTAKKEAKQASKQGAKDADMAASIIAARAKQKGIADAGKDPETGFYSVVDVEKNTDAFHNVQQWQETGKKAYKR